MLKKKKGADLLRRESYSGSFEKEGENESNIEISRSKEPDSELDLFIHTKT